MRRITKAALGGLAGCALALGGTGVASGTDLLDLLKIHEDTEDLHGPTVALDAAKAKITIDKGTDSEGRPNTTFALRVTGIDVTGIDPEKVPLGGHLHVGKCVAGDPMTALGHYNKEVVVDGKAFPTLGQIPSTTIAEVSPKTEVWFDLLPNADGMAYDVTTVPFVPVDDDGEMSVVVHVQQTNTADNTPNLGVVGFASTRQACFPLDVSRVFERPTAPTPAG